MLLTGPTTGVQEFELGAIMIDEQFTDEAAKGAVFTTSLPFQVRPSDKLYKLVSTGNP
jgi:putative protease